MNAPDPDWDRLPHDPTRFFELTEPYELRDLKRAYNRLVRRYKPERAPVEFQKIRAAFEMLSDALRYNRPLTGDESPVFDWHEEPETGSSDTGSSDTGSSDTGSLDTTASHAAHEDAEREEAFVVFPEDGPRRAPPTTSLRQRLEESSAESLYQQIASHPDKSPRDYFALALLADVVTQRNDAHTFLDWLWQGIAAHPRDGGLLNLLREHLAVTPVAELSGLLLRGAEVIQPDQFQYVTERAWDLLLREASFDEFKETLAACEQRLGPSQGMTQLVLYLHVLKPALWRADDDWIADKLDALEEQYYSLESWAEQELEMICSLQTYLQQREEFVQRGPCCERIDQAIRDWCELGEAEADRSVLACQYLISTRGHRLLEELGDPNEDWNDLLVVWTQIVEDVQERLGEVSPPEAEVQETETRDFMIRIMRRFQRGFIYYAGMTVVVGSMANFIVALVAAVALVVRMCIRLWSWQWLGALTDAGLAVVVLIGGVALSVALFMIGRGGSKLRFERLRGELIKLLRVLPLPVHELAELIRARDGDAYGDGDAIDDTDIVADGLTDDAALHFFSLAQRCLQTSADTPEQE